MSPGVSGLAEPDEMRGNVSITKSMIDYYHNYKHHFGRDDLMSLYKPNRQFIYVICNLT